MLTSWRNAAAKSSEKSATKPLDTAGQRSLSDEERLSQDSAAVKNYLLSHTLPFLIQRFSPNSSDHVPIQNLHAYDGFGLDADDITNNFLYQFLRSFLSEGLTGVRQRETSLQEDVIAFAGRILNPATYLSVISSLTQDVNRRTDAQQNREEHQHMPVHEAFEADFDHMHKEKWFETSEFIVSVSVIGVILLLVLISFSVIWNNRRKSHSFPVPNMMTEMRYTDSQKTQIYYI
jgi:hypothetical protein